MYIDLTELKIFYLTDTICIHKRIFVKNDSCPNRIEDILSF